MRARPTARVKAEVEAGHAELLRLNIDHSIRAKQELLADSVQIANFERAVESVIAVYRRAGRLYLAGNGGSAADAQHLAAEFVSRLAQERAPLPAEALTVDTSVVTAIGNDYGFEEIFARQLEAKATERDIFLALTTSGRSRNIVRALEVCRRLGVASIVFTGGDGGMVKALAGCCLVVPSGQTSTIQEVHRLLCHSLCGAVEQALFSQPARKTLR